MKHYLKKQQLFVLHKVSTLLSTLHCVSSLYSTSYLTCPPRGSTSRATCSLGYEKEFNCNFLCIRSPPVTSPLILIFFNSANYSNIYAVPPTHYSGAPLAHCAHMVHQAIVLYPSPVAVTSVRCKSIRPSLLFYHIATQNTMLPWLPGR